MVLLAREIGVGDVHIDIFEFPLAEERVSLSSTRPQGVAARTSSWSALMYRRR